MPIIAIYRGTYAGGQDVAESVAKSLGYPCVDREVLAEASNSYGVPVATLDDILQKEPRWWEQWLENTQPYRIVLQAAILNLARDGELVYHGHIGHELIAGVQHVLKVLLTGPHEFRVQQVKNLKNMAEGRARRYVEQNDRAQSRRLSALFGCDWQDSTRYGLVLNLAQMSPEAAARVIVEASRLPDYQPTVDSEQEFKNLALTVSVQAMLLMSAEFRNLPIDVRAIDGIVTLAGVLRQDAPSSTKIAQFAERLPGVAKVVTDFARPAKKGRGTA